MKNSETRSTCTLSHPAPYEIEKAEFHQPADQLLGDGTGLQGSSRPAGPGANAFLIFFMEYVWSSEIFEEEPVNCSKNSE